jgi:hypothetical protein
MSFEAYLDQAWADHGSQPEKVADGLKKARLLVETDDHLSQLVRLATHVYGDHLGQWADGLQLLKELQKNPTPLPTKETEVAILRSIEVMHIGSGQMPSLSSFNISDQVKILAASGSVLSEHDAKRAKTFLNQALDIARMHLDKKDSANRALAVAGNNLASTLEQKMNRNSEETDLMILAAQTGRKYWEIAGTWNQVAYAEYRLTMTFVQANELAKALRHAQLFSEICQENQAEDRDLFYCYEALAIVERARKNDIGFKKAVAQATIYFERLDAEHRAWCLPEMNRLL